MEGLTLFLPMPLYPVPAYNFLLAQSPIDPPLFLLYPGLLGLMDAFQRGIFSVLTSLIY